MRAEVPGPPNLPTIPTYRKVKSRRAPIFQIALTRACSHAGQMYDAAFTVIAQKLRRLREWVKVWTRGSFAWGTGRAESDGLNKYGNWMEDVRAY